MNRPSAEKKERRQREVIQAIQHEHEHPVAKRGDTQISVFLRREDGGTLKDDSLSLWPGKTDIDPYYVKTVFPFPDDDYFACWVLLTPDWSRLEVEDDD